MCVGVGWRPPAYRKPYRALGRGFNRSTITCRNFNEVTGHKWREDRTQCPVLSVHVRSSVIEYAASNVSGEGIPLRRRKDQCGTGRILRVADADVIFTQEGDLHTS
jgi:hypothetical protein